MDGLLCRPVYIAVYCVDTSVFLTFGSGVDTSLVYFVDPLMVLNYVHV